MGDDALMSARSWRWLKVRIAGLLLTDTRLSRAVPLTATPKER